VLTGRVTPSGRLPVEVPASPGAQPSTYLRTRNAAAHSGSSVDPTPLYAFGHGLSYTTFAYSDLVLSAQEVATDGAVEISCTVRNTGGGRHGSCPALPGRPGGRGGAPSGGWPGSRG